MIIGEDKEGILLLLSEENQLFSHKHIIIVIVGLIQHGFSVGFS